MARSSIPDRRLSPIKSTLELIVLKKNHYHELCTNFSLGGIVQHDTVPFGQFTRSDVTFSNCHFFFISFDFYHSELQTDSEDNKDDYLSP